MEQQLADFLSQYGYAFLFILAFLECGAFVGLFVPGETLLILAGALAGQGKLNLSLVILCAFAGAFCGDLFGYWLGRRFGRAIVLGIAAKLGYHPQHFVRTEAFFAKYGAIAIIGGRFVGVFRSLLPATAGLIAYPRKKFIPADAIGSSLWAAFFSGAGFYIGQEWSRYQPYFIATGIIIVGGAFLWGKYAKPPATAPSAPESNGQEGGRERIR